MCGRFALTTAAGEIASFFSVQLPTTSSGPTIQPRYNIAPSQQVSVIVADEGDAERKWKLFRWGLIPSWSKETRIGYRLINARCETLGEKPSFRAAFQKRRCLIVADGFYEWEKTTTGKQPHYFSMANGGLMAFAGLWERWNRETEIFSCTIITTIANELLGELHDRMPVILDPDHHEQWLDREFLDTGRLTNLFQPYPAEEMQCRAADPIVNNARNETPACLELGDKKTT